MEFGNGKLRTAGWFVVGGLAGAGIALLFAPQSGKRTRRDIRHLGQKVVNKSEAIGMELRRSVGNLVDDVLEKVHDGMGRSLDWTKRAGRDVRSAMESGKAYLQEGINKMRQAS